MPEPTLCVLCGIPGSGKTTLAKYLGTELNASVYSFDDLPDANNLEKALDNHIAVFEKIVADLKAGKNVVYDNTHLQREWRIMALIRVSGVVCKKILYVTTTPLEECLHRNAQRCGKARLPDFVVTQSAEMFEYPTMDEGWDEILYCYET